MSTPRGLGEAAPRCLRSIPQPIERRDWSDTVHRYRFVIAAAFLLVLTAAAVTL